ncbi:MAG: MFS transporter [Anaerolineae bacterium]
MKDRFLRNPYIRKLLRDPLILPFYVPSFAIFLGYGLLTPILPLYAEGFEVSFAWVGAVTSAQALGMLLTDVPSGLLLRHLGQKRAMLLGIAVMLLLRVAMSWAGSVQEALLYRLISGFGFALFGVARHAYISEHAEVANRGSAMALYGGLMRVGRFLGPLIGGFVAAAVGLRVPFVVAALVSLPAVVCVVLFVPSAARQGSERPSGHRVSGGRAAFWQMLKTQAGLLVPAGLGQIFVQMIRSGRGTIIPLYASNVLGLDVGRVGLLLSIAAAVEMVMFLPAGWLMDNKGRKYSLVPSFGIQAVAMACVPLAGGFWGLLACATAVGLGNGLSAGGMMTLGADLAPAEARGEFLGVWRLIGDIGGTGGPAAVGFVADALALPAAALTLAGSGLLAALIFGFLLPETLDRQEERDQRKSSASVSV